MTPVTRTEFDTVTAKLDLIIEILKDHSGRFQAIDQRFEAIAQRFDQLDAKVDALTEAHGQLRADFARHDEHSR